MKRVKISRIKFASLAGVMVVAGCGPKDAPITSTTTTSTVTTPAAATPAVTTSTTKTSTATAPKVTTSAVARPAVTIPATARPATTTSAVTRPAATTSAAPRPTATTSTVAKPSATTPAAARPTAPKPVAATPATATSKAATSATKVVANTPSDAYRQIQEYEKNREYSKLFDNYSKKLQGNMNAKMASAAAVHLTNNKAERKRYAQMRGKDLFFLVKRINPITVQPFQILSEKVTGGTATLKVQELGRKNQRTISMVKEKGVWKMDGEK